MRNPFELVARVPGQNPLLIREKLIERVRKLNRDRSTIDVQCLLQTRREHDPEQHLADDLKARCLGRLRGLPVFW
ncbi:MAG: hypothetical protein SNJ52_03250 [Verrucomicrobiia bacterium]